MIVDRHRRRQLAGRNRVATVGRHVDAVRVLGYRNQRQHAGILVGIDDRDAIPQLTAARLDRFLRGSDVDRRHRIPVVLDHRAHVPALLEVVHGGERIAPVLRRVRDVDVAVDAHLELHRHRVGIDERDHGRVRRRVGHQPVGRLFELAVDHDVFRVGRDHRNPVRTLQIGDLDDAIGLEVVEANARQAAVGQIVDPEVFPVG
jgi:hypothetical protein